MLASPALRVLRLLAEPMWKTVMLDNQEFTTSPALQVL